MACLHVLTLTRHLAVVVISCKQQANIILAIILRNIELEEINSTVLLTIDFLILNWLLKALGAISVFENFA